MKEIICKCGATMPEELLQVHARSAHTAYWKQVDSYLYETEVKLAQLEDVAHTKSRGWQVYEPYVKEAPSKRPRLLAIYDLTEDAIVEVE